jgi:hypothetical protein
MQLVRDRSPELYRRARLSFVGTSNQFDEGAAPRVLPVAQHYGVADAVREWPARIPYFEALSLLMRADGVLLPGSTERHYTASKIYPALLSGRPLLAVHHEMSNAVDVLRRAMPSDGARIVTYNDEGPRTPERVECIARHLSALIADPRPAAADLSAIGDVSARSLAGRMGRVFDSVAREQMHS